MEVLIVTFWKALGATKVTTVSPEAFFKVTVLPAWTETFAVTIYCVAPTGSIASRQVAITVPPDIVVPDSLSRAELPPLAGP